MNVESSCVKKIAIGYVRVSTIEDRQKLGFEAQKRILSDNKVTKIYSEKISGRKDNRPEFIKAIRYAKSMSKKGYSVTFTVVKLDRVSRKMSALLNILEDLKANKIAFKSVTENIDTSSAAGILMMQLLAMFSEFEVNTLRTRTKEALHQARLDGKILGRPGLDMETQNKIEEYYRNPDITVKEVALKCDVSERSVYRIAKDRNLSRTFKKGSSFIE
ncbi:recombinase family protein [Companilactobacillus kedongensis]|uniref:recombinase family protein n=1 Tax=Companilactobacillus kedongensis TaxID=2486004 RepID=UPI000F78BEB0|nr:recombinase family protein [Companilactobacillus kedongensis]